MIAAMAYVIAEPCIGTKDNSCVEVCPVDCIHPTPDEPDYDKVEMLFIDPEECIDCDACVEACPVDACFAEDQLPGEWSDYAEEERGVLRGALERPAQQRSRPSAGSCRPARPGPAGSGSCMTGSSTGCIGISAISPRAAWRIACAAGSSASASISGTPASACSRSAIVSGTLPSSGTSSSSASA